ncbi:hypothetical protein [Rubinisphaera brasiliensis]|uniref:Signal peptide-domain containing protein n=1 Tax=Rubinisphaera brasiliensis (strain ATCC 49424 / DSM 5305 / JCM 21570 / IAM 15109 / NBRC 103401 / IFAM 1448) TaxID=756272 RepID=F0SQT2_RUBBR|nr:hypothetical protein [Rubinisphaera brasiliensis]ADY59112.1 hypothetical protein Plabr_1501 [Rubinisphaera brasiliensis DSM 5305]
MMYLFRPLQHLTLILFVLTAFCYQADTVKGQDEPVDCQSDAAEETGNAGKQMAPKQCQCPQYIQGTSGANFVYASYLYTYTDCYTYTFTLSTYDSPDPSLSGKVFCIDGQNAPHNCISLVGPGANGASADPDPEALKEYAKKNGIAIVDGNQTEPPKTVCSPCDMCPKGCEVDRFFYFYTKYPNDKVGIWAKVFLFSPKQDVGNATYVPPVAAYGFEVITPDHKWREEHKHEIHELHANYYTDVKYTEKQGPPSLNFKHARLGTLEALIRIPNVATP